MTEPNRRATKRPPDLRPAAHHQRALNLALVALDAASVRARPTEMAHRLAEVAKCLQRMDDLRSADAYLERALVWVALIPAGAADAMRADLLCTQAELACHAADRHDEQVEALAEAGDEDLPAVPEARADRERVRDLATEAALLSGRGCDPMWEVKLLLRASDVLDRCGEHDGAVAMQNRAMALMGLMNPDTAAAPAIPPSRDALRVAGPSSLM
ncbi:hypothetical protein AACH10_04500 [Ideonella sp. DXS22W]|uniref:Tetratricopeptide repeat protein n=1 Tax=Pseudaquabacterium inlustre TaxID=2984192 RepID=A0ABU9CCW0_9BURK